MTVEMTYVALKPLRIGGKRRETGELVPEAATWKRVDAWINQGRIAPVAKAAVDTTTLREAEKQAESYTAPATEPGETVVTETVPTGNEDVEIFSVGNGWYEIPGAEKKMRHDDAVAFLASLEDDSEE